MFAKERNFLTLQMNTLLELLRIRLRKLN